MTASHDRTGWRFATTSRGEQETTIINESGLYSLIFGSKLESAKKFKHWVTSEVLPSIRQNGGYIAGQETLSDDELMAKALMVAQNKIAERDGIIAERWSKGGPNCPWGFSRRQRQVSPPLSDKSEGAY